MSRSEAAPSPGESSAARGGFSATLATLTPEGGQEPGEAAVNGTELAAATGKSGKALPLADNTGKRLPGADGEAAKVVLRTPIEGIGPDAVPIAPKSAVDERTEKQQAGIEDGCQAGAKKPETDDATDAQQALVVSAQLALPPLAGTATANEAGPASTTLEKTTARPFPAVPVPANSSDQEISAESKPSAKQQAQTPTAPAVALTIASQSAGQSERPLKSGSTTKGELATNATMKAHAVVPTSAGEAPFTGEPPTPTSALAAASASSSHVSPLAPAHYSAATALRPDAVQDLTRIVDRLAAAREAFAPASAQLAIDHADFGELTLRFDQYRTGQLAVQLAAGNPEAHRAIAAAVADRPFSAAPDSSSGQAQSQTQSQAQARGDGGGREGQAGHGASARHEQPAQRRSSAQAGKPSAGDRPRSGLFA